MAEPVDRRTTEEFHIAFGKDGPVRISREEAAERWPYRTRSPAWYAARHAHNMVCLNPNFWLDRPKLHAWLKELLSILVQPEIVERYRQELLTPDELAAVRREQADIEETGL